MIAALALAHSDGGDGNGFKRVLTQGPVCLPIECPVLPSAETVRAGELHKRIGQLQPGPSPELEAAESELRSFQAEMGELLYTSAGLCEVVGLELAVARKKDPPSMVPMQAYEDPVILQDTENPEPGEETEEDDPAALELLRSLEQELAGTTAQDRPQTDTDCRLETAEMQAFGSEPDTRLLRAAACRTALNLLAQREAGRGGEEDVRIQALGLEGAATVVRRAFAIEAELQEAVQQAFVSGRTDSAKTATRSLHRLSRARLGLVLVVDLPGSGATKVRSAPARPATRGASQPDLEQSLAEARLIKEALEERKKPEAQLRPLRRRARPGRSKRSAIAPRQKILVAILAVLVAVSVVTNLGRWMVAPEGPEVSAETFRHVAPLKSADPVKGTLSATAEPEWDQEGEEVLRRRAEELWSEARVEGYDSLVVMDASGMRPLAYGAHDYLTIVPQSAPDSD